MSEISQTKFAHYFQLLFLKLAFNFTIHGLFFFLVIEKAKLSSLPLWQSLNFFFY